MASAPSLSMATAMRAVVDLAPPKGLFWFDRKNCWSSKIGYHLSRKDERVRSQQYYSFPYSTQGLKSAEKSFRYIQYEWEAVVRKFQIEDDELIARLGDSIKRRLPIWPSKQQLPISSAPVQSVLNVRPEPKSADPTIGEIEKRQVTALLHRTTLVGRQHLKPGSYNSEKQALRLALAAHKSDKSGKMPLDKSLRLSQLSLSHLRGFHDYWHSASIKLSRRTRRNYCTAVWKMLKDAANDDAQDFNIPKGASNLFRFSGDTAKIAEYDPKQLQMIKMLSPFYVWTYCLFGLNCGMYQEDIACIQVGKKVIQLDPSADMSVEKRGEIVRLVNGKPVSLTRKELKNYDGSFDLYVSRIRNRTAHKYPYPALHWLFPETAKALVKLLADENEWNFALLSTTGKPLMVKQTDVRAKSAIYDSYDGLKDKMIRRKMKPLAFKQFRKLGVSALGSIGDDTTVRLYRSQPPQKDAAMYQLDDYEKKLTPHLKTWREQLLADGVL